MHGFIFKFSIKKFNTNMIYFATDFSIKKIFFCKGNVTDTPNEKTCLETVNLICDEGSKYISMTYSSPVLHH